MKASDIKPGDLFYSEYPFQENHIGIVCTLPSGKLFIRYINGDVDEVNDRMFGHGEFRRPGLLTNPVEYRDDCIEKLWTESPSLNPRVTELTLEDIAEKFGIPVTNLKIKK